MFHSARIQLTLWYLFIIMMITLLFSGVIYTNVNQEYTRIEKFEKVRQEEREKLKTAFDTFQVQVPPGSNQPQRIFMKRFDPQMIKEFRMRLLLTLGAVDSLILIVAGFAGYFLAGRTLQPIKKMMDEQNRFVTDASHEIRTPLTSIKSSIEVNMRNPHLSLSEAKKVLASNLEEVNNLQLLSDNLIQLTQYPKGSTQSFTAIALKVIIDDASKKVSELAKMRHIVLTKEIPEVHIEGNKQLLTELFVILLDNAIKYSPEKSTITIKTTHNDGKITIAIVDQGVGIASKDIPHIFDRFYRADTSRSKNDAPGYGLGLSIAQHIANMHKSSIHVESVLGEGTTFTITLKKADKA